MPESESVRKFVEICAIKLGWNKEPNKSGIIWEGSGVNEIGRRVDNKKIVIRIDKRYFRPSEVNSLLGDPTKAVRKLWWKPSTSLEELVSEMIEHDQEIFLRESFLKKNGFHINSNYQYE